MRKVVLTLGILFTAVVGFGQDLIIPASGEKLKCTITQIANDTIYYETTRDGITMMHRAALSDIREYRKGYFDESGAGIQAMMVDEYPKFRYLLEGNWSYMTGTIQEGLAPAIEEHIKELKTGWGLRFAGSYRLSPDYAIGVKYAYFRTTHTIKNLEVQIDGTLYSGTLQDAIQVHFIGPAAFYRNPTTVKNLTFISSFGIGYTHYINESIFFSYPLTLVGKALGLHTSAGFDWKFSEHMGIGLSVNYFYGWLSKYTTGSGSAKQTIKLEEGSLESLSRLEIGAGLRFY